MTIGGGIAIAGLAIAGVSFVSLLFMAWVTRDKKGWWS
jgi:hypothetical protein